jgi:pilus assembly protein FimV
MGLCLTAQACALGLGDIVVQSQQGAPLRAEIRLVDVTAEEAATLRAVVPPPATFLAAGADYNPSLDTVRIAVVRRDDGVHVLRLAGTRPVNDEFLDLLVEATSSSGRVLRDYTLQLKPARARP